MRSYLMQDEVGQVEEALSISAGLDYPGVGPEHSLPRVHRTRRIPERHRREVIDGFRLLSETEGIIPALECAHAVAWISREAPEMQGQTVLMNLSGRGDKDVAQMMDILDGAAVMGRIETEFRTKRAPGASCSFRTSPVATRAGRMRSVPVRRTAPTQSRSGSLSPTR